jgi:serine/threonine-protein kinase
MKLGAALALMLGAAVMAGAAPAFADSRAEAVVLFDQGLKDMKAGRLDKACPQLQASLKLVRDSGTKGALARCHGLSGRVASAWLLWRELADTAPTASLRSNAAAQATKLEPRLPRYTIKRATDGLAVQINGLDVAGNVAVPVPIDPGKVSVTAVGREADREVTERWTQDYTAVEGETLTIEIPALAPLPVEPAKLDPATRPPSTDLADRRRRRHVVAAVIGVVALGAAGGGTWFGFDARSKYDEAKRLCDGTIDQCPANQVAASQRKVDDARSAATLSSVAFGVAGAAAVTAVIVWVTAPSLERSGLALAPTASPNSVGVTLGGAF